MSKLTDIYNRLENSNVRVMSLKNGNEVKAVSFNSPGDKFYICLYDNLIESETDEVCVLAEEEAHYNVGIIPTNVNSNSRLDIISRRKNELRAKKYAVKNLVPKDKLFNMIKDTTYIDVEELASSFSVTKNFMLEALKIYEVIV